MKLKLSTYLFAAGAMAGVLIALNTDAFAHERKAKVKSTGAATPCCMEGQKASASIASAKKSSTPMCCMMKQSAIKTAKTSAKSKTKTAAVKGVTKL